MAKEKFLLIAVPMMVDCFGAFSETDNIAAIDAGAPIETPYGWIERAFEIQLVRYREATHICSFTPSAYQVWIKNEFVGIPNQAWDNDADPEGLEHASGGEYHGYGTYRDEYDSRFIGAVFTIDTMKDLEEPMRAPRDPRNEYGERYRDAIWEHAQAVASEVESNGDIAPPILNVFTYRQWEKETLTKRRNRSLQESKYFFNLEA